MNGPIKGRHYYLYWFSDLYRRKIDGWEVWESEDATHASELVKRIYRDEKPYMKKGPLVLHSDNGSPRKGATMLETLKYVPNFQPQGFASLREVYEQVKKKHTERWTKEMRDWSCILFWDRICIFYRGV